MALKTLKIPFGEMKGLMQAVDDSLLPLAYSPDCQNVDVNEGILSTRKGSSKLYTTYTGLPTNYYIWRIFFIVLNEVAVTIAAVSDIDTSTYKWFTKGTPAWVEIKDSVGNSLTTIDPKLAQYVIAPISGSDCMIIVSGGAPVKIMHDKSAGTYSFAALGGTPPNADYITMHRERVWLGSKTTNCVYYSNEYDPEDWTTAGKAGNIPVPSYDGDVLMNVANIFDDVLIWKKDSIKKVNGDIPSEYEIVDVYTECGASSSNGIAVDGNRCFFSAIDGIYKYNGVEVTPVLTKQIKDNYSTQFSVLKLVGDKLYAFYKLLGKGITYDIRSGEISVIKLNSMDDVATNKTYNGIYFTNSAAIYALSQTALLDDASYIVAYWYTPETDLGYPNAEKTLTDIYFNGWGTDSAGNAGGQVKITAYYKGMNGVQKTKEKIVTLSTTRKQHDVRLGITGRLFKFKFENVSGSAINLSGITLTVELAED